MCVGIANKVRYTTKKSEDDCRASELPETQEHRYDLMRRAGRVFGRHFSRENEKWCLWELRE